MPDRPTRDPNQCVACQFHADPVQTFLLPILESKFEDISVQNGGFIRSLSVRAAKNDFKPHFKSILPLFSD